MRCRTYTVTQDFPDFHSAVETLVKTVKVVIGRENILLRNLKLLRALCITGAIRRLWCPNSGSFLTRLSSIGSFIDVTFPVTPLMVILSVSFLGFRNYSVSKIVFPYENILTFTEMSLVIIFGSKFCYNKPF